MTIARDGKNSAAITATGDPFDLSGGVYMFLAHANAGSALSAAVQALSADGTNYVTVSSTLAHVDGHETLYLAKGQYRFSVTGTPGGGESFDLSVWRVPV